MTNIIKTDNQNGYTVQADTSKGLSLVSIQHSANIFVNQGSPQIEQLALQDIQHAVIDLLIQKKLKALILISCFHIQLVDSYIPQSIVQLQLDNTDVNVLNLKNCSKLQTLQLSSCKLQVLNGYLPDSVVQCQLYRVQYLKLDIGCCGNLRQLSILSSTSISIQNQQASIQCLSIVNSSGIQLISSRRQRKSKCCQSVTIYDASDSYFDLANQHQNDLMISKTVNCTLVISNNTQRISIQQSQCIILDVSQAARLDSLKLDQSRQVLFSNCDHNKIKTIRQDGTIFTSKEMRREYELIQKVKKQLYRVEQLLKQYTGLRDEVHEQEKQLAQCLQ